MRKNLLLAALLLSSTFTFAQKTEEDFIGTHKITFTEDKTTATSFVIFSEDKDAYVKNLTVFFGRPVQNSSGTLVWENIAVEGLGKVSRIKVFDGLMTHDTQNKSACFVPFTNTEDKQKKLAALQDNQERELRIEFTDAAGKSIVKTGEQEALSKQFLAGFIKKG